VQGERIISALEGGLITENEVAGLLYLIREPDVSLEWFPANVVIKLFQVTFSQSSFPALPFPYQHSQ